jgi:hypothetical protein
MNHEREASRRTTRTWTDEMSEHSQEAIEIAQQAIRRSEAVRQQGDRIAVPTAAMRRGRAVKRLTSTRDGWDEMPLWLRRAV